MHKDKISCSERHEVFSQTIVRETKNKNCINKNIKNIKY